MEIDIHAFRLNQLSNISEIQREISCFCGNGYEDDSLIQRFIFLYFTSFVSSIPSQYVSPLSSEDGVSHTYQHEGEVVIIVPPLNASLDDDQEQSSPKTTESTSKYSSQIFWNVTLFDKNVNQIRQLSSINHIYTTVYQMKKLIIFGLIYTVTEQRMSNTEYWTLVDFRNIWQVDHTCLFYKIV